MIRRKSSALVHRWLRRTLYAIYLMAPLALIFIWLRGYWRWDVLEFDNWTVAWTSPRSSIATTHGYRLISIRGWAGLQLSRKSFPSDESPEPPSPEKRDNYLRDLNSDNKHDWQIIPDDGHSRTGATINPAFSPWNDSRPNLPWNWQPWSSTWGGDEEMTIGIALWLPNAVLLLPPALLLFSAHLTSRATKRNKLARLCIHCHYDLRAHNPGDKCPECGTPISAPSATISPEQRSNP